MDTHHQPNNPGKQQSSSGNPIYTYIRISILKYPHTLHTLPALFMHLTLHTHSTNATVENVRIKTIARYFIRQSRVRVRATRTTRKIIECSKGSRRQLDFVPVAPPIVGSRNETMAPLSVTCSLLPVGNDRALTDRASSWNTSHLGALTYRRSGGAPASVTKDDSRKHRERPINTKAITLHGWAEFREICNLPANAAEKRTENRARRSWLRFGASIASGMTRRE